MEGSERFAVEAHIEGYGAMRLDSGPGLILDSESESESGLGWRMREGRCGLEDHGGEMLRSICVRERCVMSLVICETKECRSASVNVYEVEICKVRSEANEEC